MENRCPVGEAARVEAARHPTLRFIERSIGPSFGRFSGAANADELEELARRLVSERWSRATWERGRATDAELGAVLASLSAAAVEATTGGDQDDGRKTV